MKRRAFIKALAASIVYTGGGLPALGRVAQASSFPTLDNRVLINMMLSGGPDFRHLFPPPFDSNPDSYGYRYWQARAGAHSIAESSSAYQARWENDYLHASDGQTKFGILAKCGWLKRMWDAGNVAVISNTVGGTTRNHPHCELIMNQGNLSSSPTDSERSGWGGSLAFYSGGNVLSLTRAPRPFAYGPDLSDPDQHDNQNLISMRNTRQLALYRADDVPPHWPKAHITRSLRSYYEALGQDASLNSAYDRFVEHNRALREFGEAIEDRLSTVPLPDSVTALMEGGLTQSYLGEQIRNLFDSFICSDILTPSTVSMQLGGWDTHRTQREVIEPKLEDLFGDGKAMDVLYQELPDDVRDNAVFLFGGEFGRQLRANGDNGTDHGSGSTILVIGNAVQGAVYGEMFPEEELARLDAPGSEITGLTTIDSVYSQICEWVQPGTSELVFPDRTLSMIEVGINLGSLLV